VQVFAIGLTKDLDNTSNKRNKAVALLKSLTSETGGLAFFPQTPAELDGVSKIMLDLVRSQYVIGYAPTDKPGKDLYKKIKVQIESAGADKYILAWRVDSRAVDK
jgi:Ca-activated chloride channel family protein